MPNLKPFRGIRYNLRVVKPLADLVCPPWDVISPAQNRMLRARHPFNAVHLILADPDQPREGWEEVAAGNFRQWVAENQLRRDLESSIYAYEHEFEHRGRHLKRRGFIALCKIGGGASQLVHPHENIFAAHKENRLRLLRAVNANLSPIFLLYSDPPRNVETLLTMESPHLKTEFPDDVGVLHRFWRISGQSVLHKLFAEMDPKELLVADGHHRFSTAVTYAQECHEQNPDLPPDSPVDFMMMYFTPMEDAGLIILPTHRVVSNIPDVCLATIETKLWEYFERLPVCSEDPLETVEELYRRQEADPQGRFMAIHDGARCSMWALRSGWTETPEAGEAQHCPAWYRLTVNLLHRQVLTDLLGLNAQHQLENIKYFRNPQEAVEAARNRPNALTFLLPPTSVSDVREVAFQGDKMPQKSTDFYPKLLTGLVFHPLEED